MLLNMKTKNTQLQPASTSFNQLQPASTSFNQLQQIFLVTLLLIGNNLFAQLKVLPGGKIGVGTDDVLGTKVHIHSDMINMGLKVSSNDPGAWGYVSQFTGAGPAVKAISVWQSNLENLFITCNGSLWSSTMWVFSDGRMKTKVVEIDNPIEKIMKLRGVYYYYKPVSTYSKVLGINVNDTNRHIGFIAQEVKLVIPEVVDTTSKGTFGVNYSQLIALLTAGVQQQQGEINSLKLQIKQCCDKANPIGKKDTLINLGKTNSTGLINQQFILYQNQPNPFSVNTSINYQTPADAKGINLLVFTMQGELVKTYSNLLTGKQSVQINGSDLKPGMYLYSLVANGNEIDTKRMILSEQ
jgi:hypothetical protein